MNKRKLCPLAVIFRAVCSDGGFPVECQRERCAWWVGRENGAACAVACLGTGAAVDLGKSGWRV